MTKVEHSIQALNENDISEVEQSSNNINRLESKLPLRPSSSFMKIIGLSLIKMQYIDTRYKSFPQKVVDSNGIKERPWLSLWEDEHTGYSNDYSRHLLEQKNNKAMKCTYSRSRLCQNHRPMTRLTWIHHARRGHIRFNHSWKNILKKSNNSNTEKLFEILCVVCYKKCSASYFSNSAFVHHMKKVHPQFVPYNEYLAYFERCVICSDQTTSFQQNVAHRQVCMTELLKDIDQVGTEHFNDCFKSQREKTTLSLTSTHNNGFAFEIKLKKIGNSKTSIALWFEMRKHCPTKQPLAVQNGSFKPINSSFLFLRNNITRNKIYERCTYNLSDRIVPGSAVDSQRIDKFMIPVPFLIKNDVQSQKTYVQWRKNIKEEHTIVQSNAPWYCEICNAMVKNLRTGYCHIKMCHPVVNFCERSCESCDKRFLTVQGYKNHFNGTKNCPVSRRCLLCHQSVSINDIYEHMSQKHQYAVEILRKTGSCLICRSKVKNIDDHLFDIHGMSNMIQAQANSGKVNYRNGSLFSCHKCSLVYFTEIELRNHMLLNNHYLECSECPTLKFFLSWELMRHLAISHTVPRNGDQLICELCSRDNSVTFARSSAKIHHFIKNHISPCSVLLEDIRECN